MALHQNLIGLMLVGKFPVFVKTEGSLPHLQEQTVCPDTILVHCPTSFLAY